MVTTLARPMSAVSTSPSLNRARAPTPARCAISRDFATSSGSISTPRPRAPNIFAAAITIRPSPEPRSTTKSSAPVPANESMRSTTSSGVLMKGGRRSPSCAHAAPAGTPATNAPARTAANARRVGLTWLEFQQPLRIAAQDLDAILRSERHGFEPFRARHVGHERVVDREHDAVRAHLEHAADQRRGREIPAGADPEVLAEGVAERGAPVEAARERHVDAPQGERQRLAEVTEHHTHAPTAPQTPRA